MHLLMYSVASIFALMFDIISMYKAVSVPADNTQHK